MLKLVNILLMILSGILIYIGVEFLNDEKIYVGLFLVVLNGFTFGFNFKMLIDD